MSFVLPICIVTTSIKILQVKYTPQKLVIFKKKTTVSHSNKIPTKQLSHTYECNIKTYKKRPEVAFDMEKIYDGGGLPH